MDKDRFLTILGIVASVTAILMYKIDWPIVVANAPGIVFGLAACITAL